MSLPRHRQFEIAALVNVHPAYRDCALALLQFLDEKIPAVFADCCDRLFELAAEARSNTEQTRYFEGMREIEARRSRLCQAFVELVDAGLTNFFKRRAVSASPEAPEVNRAELRILDERDLTVTLAIDSMVDGAEIRLTRELYALGVRLGVLLDAGPLANDRNPAAPRALCTAFRDTLATVESEVEVHQALYKSFDRGIVRALEPLYRRLNRALAEAGVVPELKYSVAIDGQQSPPEDDSSPEAREPEGDALEREAAVAAAALERRILDKVQSLLARRRAVLWPPPAEPPAPTRALREVLTSLQAELAAGGADADLSPAAIKSQLLEYGGDGEPCSLAPQDEDTVDMLGMMFDFVGADRQLPRPFQAALRRLQIPYLRAALKDPGEVVRPASSARQLLEELSRTGLGWTVASDREGEILAKVNEVVDRVIHGYWDDRRVLDALLEELTSFRLEREQVAERRERRARQALHGREQLEFARQNVAQLLQRRLKQRPLPNLVRDLLGRGWSHVMVLTVLRHGLHSEQWKRALAVADELIWSVSFERSELAVKRLRTRMPVLARALAKGLGKIGYQQPEIDQILEQLGKIHEALLRDSGSDRVLVEVDSSGITISGENLLDQVDLETTETVDDEGDLSELLDRVRTWPTGKWVVFHRDGGEEVRAKLSWISPITGQYLFVDQRGLRAAEKTLKELALDLVEDRIEPLDEASIVTRAMDGISNRLRQDLAAASVH